MGQFLTPVKLVGKKHDTCQVGGETPPCFFLSCRGGLMEPGVVVLPFLAKSKSTPARNRHMNLASLRFFDGRMDWNIDPCGTRPTLQHMPSWNICSLPLSLPPIPLHFPGPRMPLTCSPRGGPTTTPWNGKPLQGCSLLLVDAPARPQGC